MKDPAKAFPSLQFPLANGYFLSMPFARERSRRLAVVAWLAAVAVATGCSTRDRLLFPDDPDPNGDGPRSTIDVPAGDTTVAAGPNFFVTGLVQDPSGIDTIYFDTEGGLSSFPPEIDPGTSFRFGLPLTTNNLAGSTITVRIYATDRAGNRGDTAVRVVTIVEP